MRKILFVVATDLSDNNSASLCHNAYIRGAVDAGHFVTVITVKPTSNKNDFKVTGAEYIFVSDENFLVRYARKRRNMANQTMTTGSAANQAGYPQLLSKCKSAMIVWFGATRTWCRRVEKVHLQEEFDVALSLSSPPTSHEVTHELLRRGKIKAKKWCQIWEDPWSTDLYNIDESIAEKENQILSYAQRILYVTPLTLERQKQLFPENAKKMGWLPLPTYFDSNDKTEFNNQMKFGYFGQYYPQVRNLQPVYQALNQLQVDFTICGDPSDLFAETKTTHIFPRVSPSELKQYEQQTDVLVFVCNLGGGQIPGKIYQYSGTDKWILFVLDGNEHEIRVIREYFDRFHRYVFCENNVNSIVQAVQSILNGTVCEIVNDQVEYFNAKNISEEIVRFTLAE